MLENAPNIIPVLVLSLLAFWVAAGAENLKKINHFYPQITEDVYLPYKNTNNLPVVFFLHDGFMAQDDWGNYLKVLAAEGYLTVALNWDSKQRTDLDRTIDFTLNKYAALIDKKRVAFIDGSLGGNLNLSGHKNLKPAMIFSISQADPAALSHARNRITAWLKTNWQ